MTTLDQKGLYSRNESGTKPARGDKPCCKEEHLNTIKYRALKIASARAHLLLLRRRRERKMRLMTPGKSGNEPKKAELISQPNGDTLMQHTVEDQWGGDRLGERTRRYYRKK